MKEKKNIKAVNVRQLFDKTNKTQMLCFSTTVVVNSRSCFAALIKHFLPNFNFCSTNEVGKLFHNRIPLSFIDISIFFFVLG